VTAARNPLGFGVFYAPFHPVGQDPTLALAQHVIPHFKGRLLAPQASHEWATDKRNELFGRAGQAIMDAIQTHVQEQEEERAS
jgi:hypothetical protein